MIYGLQIIKNNPLQSLCDSFPEGEALFKKSAPIGRLSYV